MQSYIYGDWAHIRHAHAFVDRNTALTRVKTALVNAILTCHTWQNRISSFGERREEHLNKTVSFWGSDYVFVAITKSSSLFWSGEYVCVCVSYMYVGGFLFAEPLTFMISSKNGKPWRFNLLYNQKKKLIFKKKVKNIWILSIAFKIDLTKWTNCNFAN